MVLLKLSFYQTIEIIFSIVADIPRSQHPLAEKPKLFLVLTWYKVQTNFLMYSLTNALPSQSHFREERLSQRLAIPMVFAIL